MAYLADITISNGLVYSFAPVILVMVIGFVTYLFRQTSRQSESLARIDQSLVDIERRMERIESHVNNK